MEQMFPGSYGVSPADREHALQIGIFSIDANVLCDLWRYSPKTRDKILNTMELLSVQGRLWVAFQAVDEMHRNRLKVVQRQHQRALEVMDRFWKFAAAVETAVKDRHHPTLDLEKLGAIANTAKQQANTLWKDAQKAAADPYDDPILQRVTAIIGQDFGKPLAEGEMAAAREVALNRIAARIPPGYMDSEKADGGVGDPLIWMELVRLAGRRQLPIIFVTSENKEDWWEWGADGKKRIGPRHELVTEMQKQADMVYVQLDPEELQRYGEAALNIETPEEVFEELREVSQELEPVRQYVVNVPTARAFAEAWPPFIGSASGLSALELAVKQMHDEQWQQALYGASLPGKMLSDEIQAAARAARYGPEIDLGAAQAAAMNEQISAGLVEAATGGLTEATVRAASGDDLAAKVLGLSGIDPMIDPWAGTR